MATLKYPRLRHENLNSGELCKFLEETIIGRRIIKLNQEYIELDNGYIIEIQPNWGGGSGKGESIIEADVINEPLDAAVMGLEYEESWSDEYADNTCFKIFILMKNNKISFEGSDATDGEPHYGSGFWVTATMPNDREAQS